MKEYLKNIENKIKKIEKYINNNKVMLIIMFLFLILLFNRFLFGILELPWGISYMITSLFNGQFDGNILNDILSPQTEINYHKLFFIVLSYIIFLIMLKILYMIKKIIVILFFFILVIILFWHYYYYKFNFSELLNYILIILVIYNLIFFLLKKYINGKEYPLIDKFIINKGLEKIFIIVFIVTIISINFIDNNSLINGIKPVRGYIYIGNNINGEIKEIHNKLQLPDDSNISRYNLKDKEMFINLNGRDGKVLTDICILAETKNNYYVSNYYSKYDFLKQKNKKKDNTYTYHKFNCITKKGAIPIKISKNSGIIVRKMNGWGKDVIFNEFKYNVLITNINNEDVTDEKLFSYYTIFLFNKNNLYDIFFKTIKINNDLYVDNIIYNLLNKKINKIEYTNKKFIEDINKRDTLINDFLNNRGEKISILKYVTNINDIEKLFDNKKEKLKIKNEELKKIIKEFIQTKNTYLGTNFNIQMKDNIKSEFKYIKIKKFNLGPIYTDITSIKFEDNKRYCIEFLSKDNLIYSVYQDKIKLIKTIESKIIKYKLSFNKIDNIYYGGCNIY